MFFTNNTNGTKRPINKTKVMVAMSGGVDSSLVAVLLKRIGYDVLGVTLQLAAPSCGLGACCTGRDLNDVKQMCADEGFEHVLVLARDDFKSKVINYTVDSYAKGLTPSPCVWCNSKVRFDHLYQTMEKYGCDLFVTGHYAYVETDGKNFSLLAGVDPQKDQSYFLSMLPKHILEKVRFPLGNLTKQRVRQLARRLGIAVSEKKDSQDLCFVKDSYSQTLWNLKPEIFKPGLIKDTQGKTVGTHEGIAQYTVGQRKGINAMGREQNSSMSPLYVLGIDSIKNEVTVGHYTQFSYQELYLEQVNLFESYQEGMSVEVVIRARSEKFPARLWSNGKIVRFQIPIHNVARGQICVMYVGRKVVGAGLIANFKLSKTMLI